MQNFIHKCKLCLVGIGLQQKLFFEAILKWWKINSAPGLNRGLSSNCSCYRRIWDVYREACFSQKYVYKSLNMVCHYELLKRHSFSGNTLTLWWRKSSGTASVKKVMLWQSFGTWIGPLTIDFLEKGATVNSVSYCKLLW